MTKYYDDKMTPNQLAKHLILDAIDARVEFWLEANAINEKELTEKEIEQVTIQLHKRFNSIKKLFGMEELYPYTNNLG